MTKIITNSSIIDKTINDKTVDELSINELVETNTILNDNQKNMDKQLKTAHNYYDVKNLLTILTSFATSDVGSNAKVMLVLPDGRNPMQKEFNIKEITLVENKIIGSREKYRCVILVQQFTLKPESKLWQKVKKNTPNIIWTRVESWASFGFPDLVGYTEKTGFFTVELKVTKSNKITFSPHQIAFHIKHPTNTFILVQAHDQICPILYEGSAIQQLAACGLSLEACRLPLNSWSELENLLLTAAPLVSRAI